MSARRGAGRARCGSATDDKNLPSVTPITAFAAEVLQGASTKEHPDDHDARSFRRSIGDLIASAFVRALELTHRSFFTSDDPQSSSGVSYALSCGNSSWP